MQDLELFIAHNVFLNKGAYAIFLGSGISRSAGIPTGWEIIMKLIDRLSVLKQIPVNGDYEQWFKEHYQTELNYSKIIELLTNTREERVNLLKPFFEPTEKEVLEGIKQPTVAHKAIAALVKKGYIKVIITTNFDRLMENALREIGIEATVISNPNHIENVMPIVHSPITIIKINGDYLDIKFLNLESELSSYDVQMEELLKYVFENFGLITTGWSAKWDIRLRELLESSNKFRFSNFFTYIKSYEEELKNTVDFRKGKLVAIKDANSFFKEILENIEALEKSETNSPLTKPVALERLKKYVEKQDGRIDLFELLNEETNQVINRLNNYRLTKPDKNTIKQSIEFDIKQLDLLNSLMITGVYWGKEQHHELWLKLISKFSYPKRETISYSIWSSLSYLPALILFYAIGLAALLKQDFTLLKKLFKIKIFNHYNEGEKINFIQNINTHSVIGRNELNDVYDTNQYVPMSELLYRTLKPEFAVFLADEKEYSELFEDFEILTSLKYIELFGKNGTLLGRFYYHRRSDNDVVIMRFKEINSQKENFVWIKEGLFINLTSLIDMYSYLNKTLSERYF